MPPLIRSRYEQYKRDTQQFTTWLAQTAISLGYPISKFDEGLDVSVEGTEQSAKSKKNAKKKARAKEKVKMVRDGVEEGQKDEESKPIPGT